MLFPNLSHGVVSKLRRTSAFSSSNPAGKRRSRDYTIDVPATPTLPDPTKKLSTGANEQNEDARCFQRAVMINL